jgi:hypothetical protein
MNNEQQELLDEAYVNYGQKIISMDLWMLVAIGWPSNQEEFINKCKTDTEFSERWGLKIEERELSRDERCDEYIKRHPKETNDGILNYKWIGDNLCTHEDYDKWNIPTKLITITYNDTKLESYE